MANEAANRIQGLTGEVSVPVSPAAAVAVGSGNLVGSRSITVQASPSNTAVVFIGDSSVTTANGLWLAAGGSITIPVNDGADVYVIAAAAGQKVRGMVV